jgi:hypothetical protein
MPWVADDGEPGGLQRHRDASPVGPMPLWQERPSSRKSGRCLDSGSKASAIATRLWSATMTTEYRSPRNSTWSPMKCGHEFGIPNPWACIAVRWARRRSDRREHARRPDVRRPSWGLATRRMDDLYQEPAQSTISGHALGRLWRPGQGPRKAIEASWLSVNGPTLWDREHRSGHRRAS